MTTFLITAGVFLFALTIMSVGVLFAKKPIQGSCGGLSALSDQVGKPLCEVCGGDPDKRPKGCGDEEFEIQLETANALHSGEKAANVGDTSS